MSRSARLRRRTGRASRPVLGSNPERSDRQRGARVRRRSAAAAPKPKVSASIDLIVMDQVGDTPALPSSAALHTARREKRSWPRGWDALGVEEAALVFPIEAERAEIPSVRQPIERDVVEPLVTRKLTRGARGPVRAGDRRRWLAVGVIVVEAPGSQADG